MDNKVEIFDEMGNKESLEILFEFEGEEFNYVVLHNPEDGSDDVFAFKYSKDDEGQGKLLPIDTDEEWNMVEEVLGAFEDENLG